MGLTGECFCGEVKYQIAGPLVDPLSCHCSRCQKAFSSASSHYARVSSGDFRWVVGEEKLTSYVGKHGFGLLFCSTCGSTLCGTVDGSIHGVALGCLNEEPELEEIHHIYVASKASWEVMPNGITTFPEGRQPSDRR
ncbi:MAG: GFA family protein [Gammaproteobacteria bacterium]|nr:GFA family protein [Gammaproteobacteria bacterium]NNL50893.1 GFA family protein [Woeseiaceae bacterium]